jgi:amidase
MASNPSLDPPHWKPAVLTKRNTQINSIPTSWQLPESVLENLPASSIQVIRSSGILTADELSWTETTDIRVLVSLITSRRVSSEQLTTAFCKRTAIAQQVNKCLTEIFFERALAKARVLDEYLERTGKVIGPLHGIPVSVKDRFDVRGVDTTVGQLQWTSSCFRYPFPGYLDLC